MINRLLAALHVVSCYFLFFQVLYHSQLDLFQFLEDVSSLIQEASSVVTNWRGVAGF